ncbi:MAG: hypothetical protein NC548_36100 [Lachnospiraceae bacterium]|nr:hypothetical protein [Lachnospiraceae bacterium]
MNVKELIRELQRLDPDKAVYFRKGRSCYAVASVKNSEHANGLFVELSNPECDLKAKHR